VGTKLNESSKKKKKLGGNGCQDLGGLKTGQLSGAGEGKEEPRGPPIEGFPQRGKGNNFGRGVPYKVGWTMWVKGGGAVL